VISGELENSEWFVLFNLNCIVLWNKL